ncbi:hypothetical protein H6G74_17140 [Nostoc spongiaeforme FACHB-130]|uniref:Uncharacterized protein n=1 Tax=Nostoc spongiaeforme FACHB-130 TaxID=1357510 RepID=A0ABR8FZJ5_9NOSO|nr:hypothetical protein [Nostoc spongiaeforme]MBD2596037.1 hypothetical protein [Nostoc spongiaeforme FACHB-130]
MTKKSMKSALTNSLKAEDEAVRSRFEKAERLLEEKTESNSSQLTTSQPQDIVEPAQLQKVIRDSFTLPSGDYELITTIRQRCLNSAVNVTKSEVVRAGLHILQSLSDEELVQAINSLEKVKTGRPSAKQQKV